MQSGWRFNTQFYTRSHDRIGGVVAMGKGDKKTAATSSRAAELLAKSGSGRPQTGFGG